MRRLEERLRGRKSDSQALEIRLGARDFFSFYIVIERLMKKLKKRFVLWIWGVIKLNGPFIFFLFSYVVSLFSFLSFTLFGNLVSSFFGCFFFFFSSHMGIRG